jgi:hypothetical protein
MMLLPVISEMELIGLEPLTFALPARYPYDDKRAGTTTNGSTLRGFGPEHVGGRLGRDLA